VTASHATTDGITRLNALPSAEAVAALLTCCGSHRWARQLTAARPFPSIAALHEASDRIWFSLSREDWLEAFSHHPRIGDRNISQPRFAATATQAAREQSGMAAATPEQLTEFTAKNADYERRFNHVFLICATGKSAAHMLDQLRARITNDPKTELQAAAREQSAITRLRLERWLLS
jgi:2-oxo-4-hydroxy-4-carboxy-5-ureidoimidazoline decarboxylase